MSDALIGLLLDEATLLTQDELCGGAQLSREELEILAGLGLVASVQEATYPASCLRQARRAARLKRGLDTEWETAALVMDLLGEIEALRSQIRRLQAQQTSSLQSGDKDPQ